MRKLVLIAILSCWMMNLSFGQSGSHYKTHAFSRTMVLSLEGGITLAKTDFKTDKLGLFGRGMVEYFLPTNTPHVFGFRLFTGGLNLSGKDVDKQIDEFNTDIYILGGGISYSYGIEDKIFPFIYGGISYLWFSPKDQNGRRAPNNLLNKYDRTALSFDTEIGLRFIIQQNWSIHINTGFHFVSSDDLDDISLGTNNDFYLSGMVGISLSLFGKKDSDGDGIFDDKDYCPGEKEDFDGFEDEDGCPDLDNDGDGVPDITDGCPNEPEDFDGYLDNDGCPDFDNDNDGIPDSKDLCPDEAEDFDGLEDNDGCPDIDVDKDGILDYADKCPTKAEDFDGFEDDDGCPDNDNDNDGILDVVDICPDQAEDFDGYKEGDLTTQDDNKPVMLLDIPKLPKEKAPPTKEIVIHGEITFLPNSAEIKPEAHTLLNKIVDLLKLYPSSRWKIEGHMDNEGAKETILTISQKRADAIKNYFVSKGLNQEQFVSIGMGDRSPIESNATEYGRMRNRRVVITQIN